MSITLFNAGRGAGKTYTLVQWAKEDPKRVVVGSNATREAMEEALLSKQFLSYTSARSGLTGIANDKDAEMAFDDFDQYIQSILVRDFRLTAVNSVILATNFPEHEKSGQPNEFLDLAVGALETLGAFATDLLEKKTVRSASDKLFGFFESAINENGFKSADESEPAPVPDTKEIRAKELRIGDVLAGRRGKVVGISVEPREGTTKDTYLLVQTKDTNALGNSYDFTGTLRVWAEFKVEIDA